MSCPLCRKEFIVPENGLGGLPRNFFIEKLKHIKQMSGNESTVVCEVCELKRKTETTAAKYCVECQQNLCESCCEDHGIYRVLRDHKLVDLDDLRGAGGEEVFRTTTAYCTKHKDQSLTVFCRNCKIALCIVCHVTSHKQHDSMDISDVVKTFRQQMTTDMGSLSGGIGRLREMLESMEHQKEEFNEHVTLAKDAINKKADELMDELTSRKDIVLKQLENLRHEITQRVSFMESLKKYTGELASKGADGDVAREASVLHDRVEELLKVDELEDQRNKMGVIDVKFVESTSVTGGDNFVGGVRVEIIPHGE